MMSGLVLVKKLSLALAIVGGMLVVAPFIFAYAVLSILLRSRLGLATNPTEVRLAKHLALRKARRASVAKIRTDDHGLVQNKGLEPSHVYTRAA